VGPADAPHGDDGDAAARADRPAWRRAITTRDAAQHDVEGAGAEAVGGREVAEARGRREEGGGDPEADDRPEGDVPEVAEAGRGREEGRRHTEAHDGAQGHHAEVAEAHRRGEEGRRHPEADRTEGRDHPEADDGADAHDVPEVAEAHRRGEEGGGDTEASDGARTEGRLSHARHVSAVPVGVATSSTGANVAGRRAHTDA
jgi:hypothetical protein